MYDATASPTAADSRLRSSPQSAAESPPSEARVTLSTMLGHAILAGEYQPGDLLPGEIALVGNLRVARGTVREAMQNLAAKGLVESRPKVGTRVLPRSRWNLLDADVLAWAFGTGPEVPLLVSLSELREVIEPAAAALAAERCRQEDLQILRGALAGMRRHAVGSAGWSAAIREFHGTIMAATQNESLAAAGAGILAVVGWSPPPDPAEPAPARDPLSEHTAVYEAILGCDPDEAAHAMRELIDAARAEMGLAIVGREKPRCQGQPSLAIRRKP